jgi:hypothetical protein
MATTKWATLDAFEDTLFDRVALDGPLRIAFAAPVGQMVKFDDEWKVKGFEDTNMVQSGMMPAPERFGLRGWTCALFDDGRLLPASDPLYHRVALRLMISEKCVMEANAFMIADPNAVVIGLDLKEAHRRLAEFPQLGQLRQSAIWIDTHECFHVEVISDVRDREITAQINLIGVRVAPNRAQQ